MLTTIGLLLLSGAFLWLNREVERNKVREQAAFLHVARGFVVIEKRLRKLEGVDQAVADAQAQFDALGGKADA